MDELAVRLRRWFRRNRRDLPWRRTRDPYAILVSEFMLQQTRVAAVEGRYEAFRRRFPTVEALAEAGEDEVLALWSGLGYYRRARNLHAAARAIRDHHGGVVPGDAPALRELPGIGAYTAAAVASIAFGRPEALVDGNVARVLARIFRLKGDPRTGTAARRLREAADKLVPRDGTAGEWNEALMELGATICLPRRPRCDACPAARDCGGRREGRSEAYGGRAKSATSVPEVAVRIAIERGGRWLLRRNGPDERPAGMFEFPALGGIPSDAPLERVLRAAGRELGLELREARELGRVRHQIMNRAITVRVVAGFLSTELGASAQRMRRAQRGEFRWVRLSELGDLPVSAATLRAARLLTTRRAP
ncbi:MAG: A/G-specific adenine glycosylase [Deltaproteobacteria bacterium]|nr:A/G-specific adenine glycosylase [Deltaproteobacteria bacterium]